MIIVKRTNEIVPYCFSQLTWDLEWYTEECVNVSDNVKTIIVGGLTKPTKEIIDLFINNFDKFIFEINIICSIIESKNVIVYVAENDKENCIQMSY